MHLNYMIETFKGKTVLITGHTGFKGGWLTTWLINLGANVVGISKDVPTTPSIFDKLNLKEKITKDKEAYENYKNSTKGKTLNEEEYKQYEESKMKKEVVTNYLNNLVKDIHLSSEEVANIVTKKVG